MIKRTRTAAIGLLLASSLAMAQTPYTEDSTYQGLGGKEGIKKIVDTFVTLITTDPRIKDSFTDFDLPQLNQRLQEQFCEFAGGPCKYTGKYHDKAMEGVGPVRDMKTVHQDLQITNAMFNALPRICRSRWSSTTFRAACEQAGRQTGAHAARHCDQITGGSTP
jgi:hemoglobin